MRIGRARDYALVLAIAFASRAVIALVAAAAKVGTAPGERLRAADIPSLFASWDAGWYLRIVASGYDPVSIPDATSGTTPHAFFPVYPMLVRGVVALTDGQPAATGVAVAAFMFVVALCLVFDYVRDLGLSRDVALGTIVLICCAPHSFVFTAVYAESTFLALLAAAMLALRRGQHALSGLAAALLSATRPNGVLFIVFALAHTLRVHGWRPLVLPWTSPGPALAIVLAPLGLVAYWWFCYLTTGDAFAQATAVRHGWYWAVDWPWTNLALHLRGSSTDRFWAWGSLLYFAASLILLGMRRLEEFAYCCASFLLVWSNVHPPSLVRYAVVLFPIFIALASACAARPLRLALLASGFAALNALLVVAFALQWPIAV